MKLCIPFSIWILGTSALLANTVPAEQPAPELDKVRQLFMEAGDLQKKKEHAKAIGKFTEGIGLVPADSQYDEIRATAHYYIALNQSVLGNQEEAMRHIEQAIENGLTEIAYIEKNPDFEAFRRSKEYSTVSEKIRRKTDKMLKAFDFTLAATNGTTVRKKDFFGQVLIVDVWGTWCPPCQMEIPHFIELHRRYSEQGLRIVGLNYEKVPPAQAAQVVKNYVEKAKIPYPCGVADQKDLARIPNLSAFPTTLFFGRDGTPRAVEVGARDLAALEKIVKPLLAEPPPAAPARSGPAAEAPASSPEPARKP